MSLEELQANRHLWSLYLLGNPCDQWHGYRAYVTGVLPQLRTLVIQPPRPGPQPPSPCVLLTDTLESCVGKEAQTWECWYQVQHSTERGARLVECPALRML